MPGTAEQAITLFYSYAHEDEALRQQLEKHLSLLQQQDFIAGWHDRLVRPGVDWAQEIDMYLNTARIILLLVSPDFMASQYCIGIEMKRALERSTSREARVIPIILRPIDWEMASFSMLQALPTGGKPVQSAHWHSPDEAFADIARGIRTVVQELRAGVALTSGKKPALPWHVPYRRNPLFTGREDLLQQLHERFITSNSGDTIALSQSQAISGLGGIGKTQTALEYAYRYRQEYRAVLWVNAASEEALQVDMIKLADVLGLVELPGLHDQEPLRLIAILKDWLTEQRDWLLILDNVDDLAMTLAYLPESGTNNGHILLTTRAQAGGHHIRMMPVEQMNQEEGTLLLLRRAKVLSPEEPLELASAKCRLEAEAIVAELGGLPLAIDQAGAYLEETGSILSSYLDLYRVRRKELLRRRSTLPSEHPEPVATTWSLSFQHVEEASQAAADLLRLCAFLHPDAIPEAMLVEGGKHLGSVLAPVMADPFALNVAIEELRKFSLIRRNAAAGLLSLHRLVQAVLKDAMEKKVQQRWAKRTVLLINAAFPVVEFATWERCQLYLPHALACAALIETYHFTFEEAADLLNRVGWYLQEQALYEQAEPFYQRALAIREQKLGSDHPHTAKALNNLAFLYWSQDKYEQAEPLYQRALAINEQQLGPDHPHTATNLDNLAKLYRSQDKYEQAEPLYQRALAIREQRLGPEHPDTAITLNNLAFLYWKQKKYEQAEPLYQRALAIKEQQLDSNHPDTAKTLDNLAKLYRSQGKHEQAEPLYQRALAIKEQQLDPNHPDTAITLQNLALLYHDQGKYEQAASLYQRALAIREQRRDSDHLDTVSILLNLAQLYRSEGKYEQAEPLFLRALAIREQIFGPEHPRIVPVLKSYAALLRDMHRDEEAAALIKRAQASHKL